MYYADTGTGTPLVLIHGFPHDHTLWKPQLEGLGDGIRVIAPDLRGFGDSTEVPERMTMDEYAADVKRILDSLGIRQAVIGGLSMGGYVALAFMARYPEAVRGLLLCNTRAGSDDDKARTGRYDSIKKVEAEGVGALAEAMLPKMIAANTATAHPDRRKAVREMMARQRPKSVTAALRGLAARPDRVPILPAIKVPTLIITGSKDELIPVKESEAMAAAIPGSRLVVIPDVAHLSNVEDPEAFNKEVKEFVGGLGA